MDIEDILPYQWVDEQGNTHTLSIDSQAVKHRTECPDGCHGQNWCSLEAANGILAAYEAKQHASSQV